MTNSGTASGQTQMQLPAPYADWRLRFQEAKSVLDGLTLQGISTSRDSLAYGCVNFARATISGVRRAYEVDHPRGELTYDLVQADGIIRLASCLLECDVDGIPAQRIPGDAPDPMLVQTLCRACSGCIEELLKVLPFEALHG